MPTFRFIYDDRKEYRLTRGKKTYIFDPTCEVEDPIVAKELFTMPKTFKLDDGDEKCEFCGEYFKNINVHKRFCKSNPDSKYYESNK